MKIINEHKNFLIISLIVIITGGGYWYFSNDLNSEKIVPVAFGSLLSSSAQETASLSNPTLDEKIASDISFLTTLVSIKKINIDTTLFTNSFFNALNNNSVKIEPVVPGRINPFAPVDNFNNNIATPNVVTDKPTQITEKTVILGGTINIATGVTDTYFEYGINEQNLNNVTATAKQSLVGTYIKNVSGLIPKTTYFYKACAKINNLPLCGQVVSFTTN